jgi:TonB family protein
MTTLPFRSPVRGGLLMAALALFAAVLPAKTPVGALAEGASGEALVSAWTPPVYPPALQAARVEGKVKVRFIVEANGAVTGVRAVSATDPRFETAAVAAVRRWKFDPALDGGRAIASCLEVPVLFRLADVKKPPLFPPEDPVTLPVTPPVAVEQPGADYPPELLARNLPGQVRVQLTVDAKGRAQDVAVGGATHVDFVLPALAALQRWKFQPAMQGDLALSRRTEVEVDFTALTTDAAADPLAANGLSLRSGSFDHAPAPFVVADPVYPYDLLLAGAGGEARVDFTVAPNGLTRDVTVRDALSDEFGRALAAALETWAFKPALKDGRAVAAKLAMRWTFAAPDAATDPADAQLVARARGGDAFSARGLDAQLTPLYRVSPVYPAALRAQRPEGDAVIDFIIDRDGRARLPRIVSASAVEFGWAAATAVAQWVFAPPRHGGQPVDVRVEIPFHFAPPPAE